MRAPRNITIIALAVTALAALAGCVVLASLLWKRLAIEATLRADPAAIMLHQNSSIPTGRPRLLVLGDSRAADLAREAIPPWTVVNRGVPGQTAAEVLARGARDLALLEPDHVLLVVGINDLKSNAHEDSVEHAATAVDELARVALKLRVPLTVVAVWREGDVADARRALLPSDIKTKVDRLNERLRSIVASQHATFLAVDALLTSDGLVASEFAKDTLHLNDTGNKLLAASIASTLSPTPAR